MIDWGDYSEEAEQLDDRKAETMAASDWMKWQDGDNWVRLLPPLNGEKSPFDIVEEHRVKIEGREYDFVFVCPGGGCETCRESDRLRATGSKADEEYGYQMSKRARVYMRVLDRRYPELGPRKASISFKTYEALREARVQSGKNLTSVKDGYDVNFIKLPAGSPKNRTRFAAYKIGIAQRPSPLGSPEQIAEYAQSCPEVKSLAPYKSVEAITALLNGESAPSQRQIGSGRTVGDTLEPGDDL